MREMREKFPVVPTVGTFAWKLEYIQMTAEAIALRDNMLNVYHPILYLSVPNPSAVARTKDINKFPSAESAKQHVSNTTSYLQFVRVNRKLNLC